MPPVIAAIAAYVAAYAYVIAVVAVVASAGMVVYGTAQARRAERDAKNAALASMKDRMVTRIATESPHRYIYGRAKVGADIVAMFTSGDRDQFKHLVCVHAAHECDAIEEVWVNNAIVDGLDNNGDPTVGRFATDPSYEIGEQLVTGPTFTLAQDPRPGSIWVFSGTGSNMAQVPITGVNGRTVTVAQSGQLFVSYEYYLNFRFADALPSPAGSKKPVVRVQRHLGGPNDPADAYLRSQVGDKWPATAVLRGLCYTVITLDLNHPEFQSGLVPIHAVIRGKKLYDPRDGITRWSQNPALAIRDYLTGPLCGVPAADLPAAQFITAANVCDEASPTGGARYTLNGTVTSDQGQASVLESMTQAMAGGLVATTWDVYAGKYVAPVAALLQSDIVGNLSVTPGVSDASVYNGVKGQYIGPENKYVQTDFKPYQNSVYRESDGRDLYTNLDFPFTDSLQRVTNLARVFTEDQRNGFTIRAEFSLKAWPLKVGQRITFTSAVLGHNAKVFRITDKSYSPTSAVQLVLKEDAASIWDYADATVVDSTPNSDLPDPWKIDAPASLSCTSGEAALLRQADGTTVPRIMASWPAMAQANGVQAEVEWRAVSSNTWERTTVSASEPQAYLSPITPGYFYIVRARTVNPSLNVRSPWTVTVYQVEVFTARPTVYMWAANKPGAPAGTASYVWPTGAFGAAPANWSLTQPVAPVGVGNMVCWAATVPVSNISASGSTPFNWATATVTAAAYDAAAVIAAKTAADAANQGVADMSRDDLLSPSEKASENLRWITIVSERPGIDSAAAALGVTTERTAYTNAYNTLSTYIGGLGAGFATIPGVAISIVGATYRANFKSYYDAKQSLLNAITAKSATVAVYDNVSGRPYDVSNLVKKGTFEDGSLGTWSSGFVEAVSSAGTSYKNQLTTVARDVIENGNKFPVTPGEKLYFLANLNAMVTGFTCAFGVVAYDKNNVAMYCQVCYRSPGQGFGLVEGVLTVPAGAVAATPWLQQDGPPGFTGNYLGANGLWIGRHAPGATVGATWGVNVGGSNKPADNATVGAPAGTNVGSTPATTIEANANGAATAILSDFTASLSGTASGSFPNGSAGYGTIAVNIAGGNAPYTVRWILVEELVTGQAGIMTLSTKTGTSTNVSGSGQNASLRYELTCIVTDAKQRSITTGRNIFANHGTPP